MFWAVYEVFWAVNEFLGLFINCFGLFMKCFGLFMKCFGPFMKLLMAFRNCHATRGGRDQHLLLCLTKIVSNVLIVVLQGPREGVTFGLNLYNNMISCV